MQDGVATSVRLAGTDMSEILEPDPPYNFEGTTPERCGVFTTKGSSLFWQSKLEAIAVSGSKPAAGSRRD